MSKEIEEIEHLIAIRAIDNIEGVKLIKDYCNQQLKSLLEEILKHKWYDETEFRFNVSVSDIRKAFEKLNVKG